MQAAVVAARAHALASALAPWRAGGASAALSIVASHCSDTAIASTSTSTSTTCVATTQLQQHLKLLDLDSSASSTSWQQQRERLSGASLALQALERALEQERHRGV